MVSVLTLEVFKSAKLKLLSFAILVGIVIAILSTFSLLSGATTIEEVQRPDAWNTVSLSMVFFSALMWPMFVSVLASKQIENEFQYKGWFLLSMSGIRPVHALFVKGLVAFWYLMICNLVQHVSVISVGKLAGITATIGIGWFKYFIGLMIVGIVFYSYSALVSIALQNQFYTILFGFISSFLSVFFMLIDVPGLPFFPWSYFSLISPVRMLNGDIVSVNVAWPPIMILSALSISLVYYISANKLRDL